MRVWYRGAALAIAALLWGGAHARAQIRESVGLPPAQPPAGGLTERSNHPVVLLNSHEGQFTGGEQTVAQFMLKQMDPRQAVAKVAPPKGIDGIIAYPGSRTLMVRGTREAVAGYRASLERLDRQAGAPSPGKTAEHGNERAAPGERPVIVLPAGGALRLQADRLEQNGALTRATGHVVIELGSGIELRARQVRVTHEDGQRRIVIER